MTEQFTLEGVDLEVLYEAGREIDSAFRPLSGSSPPNHLVTAAEDSAMKALGTLYRHLFAMSKALLKTRASSAGSFYLSSRYGEFEEMAHVAAEIPFSSRGKDRLLEAVNLVMRFFSGHGEAGEDPEREKEEFFFFLRDISSRNVNQATKTASRSDNRLLHYIHLSVTRHISRSSAYSRKGRMVFLDDPGRESRQGRQATAEELVKLCSPDLGGVATPGRVVDIIFSRIAADERFSVSLDISTLRNAVFDLLGSKFAPPQQNKAGTDPLQEYLSAEMLALAEEALAETDASYGWRKGGSAEHRQLFGSAAREILHEIIVQGRKPSFAEAVSRQAGQVTLEEYRAKYMGSFQNFWKQLWGNFLKKIRAD